MQSSLVEKGAAYKMLLDGTTQAASTHVSELFLHRNLSECLESISKTNQIAKGQTTQSSSICKIALDNVNPTSSLTQYLKSEQIQKPVIAAIGSERGWTNNERTLLEQNGFIRCGMGNRVLRTETAATVASSIILSELGVLN